MVSSKAHSDGRGEGKIRVRSALIERDAMAVLRLYTDGLELGAWLDNDVGADVDNLHEAYFHDDDQSHFWVAELVDEDGNAEIVGMIGVLREDQNTAEVRRLRVDAEHESLGVGRLLLEKALDFCRHRGYLRVRLNTRADLERAIALFNRFGFQHTRTRTIRNGTRLDFMLDLYRNHDSDEATDDPGEVLPEIKIKLRDKRVSDVDRNLQDPA